MKKGATVGSIVGIIIGVAMAIYALASVRDSAPSSSTWSEVFDLLNIGAAALTYVFAFVAHPSDIGAALYPYLVFIVLQWGLLGAGAGAAIAWFTSTRKSRANQSLQGTPGRVPFPATEPGARRS
jgi:hypothetical protein